MRHPGFLLDFDKIIAWLGFNDKNYNTNRDLYTYDPHTCEISVDGIVVLSESVGFIRVKFKEVKGFESKNSSLISLLGSPKHVTQRFLISNAKNLISFEGITEFSNTLTLVNCITPKLPSYISIKKTTCVHLELFEKYQVDLCGINNIFNVVNSAQLLYNDVVKGGLEILNMTVNYEGNHISVILKNPSARLRIIEKYLNNHNPQDYIMDCYMELIDNGYEALAEM